METVFALSTAPGKAGVAIVRMSGAGAWRAAGMLFGELPPPRRAGVRILRDPEGRAVDQAVVLVFEQGQSFTGEDMAELHLHGSIAVVSRVLNLLDGMEGLRRAEPGEFTRRAFENGRLDLPQVEGLADLIDAETEMQRRQAFRVLSGALGQKAENWRARLIRASALVEATIDFADEEVPVDVVPEVRALLRDIAGELRREIAGVGIAERIREGFEVAIVGAPNVGKSTLLNTLAGRDAAITSEHAGTTRDVIEVRMDLGGLPVTVLDTAGIRETTDAVEEVGVARAMQRARDADLRIFLVLPGKSPEIAAGPDDIILIAKADLHPGAGEGVSGVTGEGIRQLVTRIKEKLECRIAGQGLATRERHRLAMVRGLAHVEEGLCAVERGDRSSDIAAEELRSALRALDNLVGRVDVEAVLDEIFANFCIGK